MTRPAVRLLLLIVFLAALGVTSYLFWMAEQDILHAQTTARSFDDDARAAILTAHDLRTAQQAYVASGQGPDFWFARTTAIQAELKGQITTLRSHASSRNARRSKMRWVRCRISSRWMAAPGSTSAPGACWRRPI